MNMTRLVFILTLFTVCTSTSLELVGQELSLQKHAAEIDAVAIKEMKSQQLVGLAIGIIHNGQVGYVKGYGFEDRENKVAVTAKSLFRWASISKTLTAITALQLVDQKKLKLDSDVRSLIPEFPQQSYDGKPVTVTIRQLLSHHGGIVHYSNGKVVGTRRKYIKDHPFKDVVVALDTFNRSPLVHTPGKEFSYTTHGFILLSAAVQRAGNEPFAEQVHKRIAQPLKLTTLRPDYQWETIPHRAVGYKKIGNIIIRSTNSDVSWKLGGGGFLSSIEDLAKYNAGLVRGGLVTKTSQETMWTPQGINQGQPSGYGLGFSIRSLNGVKYVGHSGAQEKTRTDLSFIPQKKIGVVVMTNSEYGKPKEIARALYPLLRSFD